jgi:hypothetical protein
VREREAEENNSHGMFYCSTQEVESSKRSKDTCVNSVREEQYFTSMRIPKEAEGQGQVINHIGEM